MAYVVIENPMVGKTYRHDDEFGVYEYGTYGRGSVLEGQERRTLLERFDSLDKARAAYPRADVSNGSQYREIYIPDTAPDWFDPEAAGESWDGE
jgi:hypothetical protein